VRIIRLKHGIMRKRSQSHPRRIKRYLTVTQIAAAVGLSHHYIYDRIHNGTIEVVKDQATGLFLFPDKTATLELFRQLKSGRLKKLRFSKEHQHA
jgi:excisionase family DNA binding protein